MRICEHCGAVWDERHETEGCPVRGATARILAAHKPRKAVWERSRLERVRERLKELRRYTGGQQ